MNPTTTPAQKTVQAASAGGFVKVTAYANPFRLISLEINHTVLDDTDLLSAYVIDAVNKAAKAAFEAHLRDLVGRDTKSGPPRLRFRSPVTTGFLQHLFGEPVAPEFNDVVMDTPAKANLAGTELPQPEKAEHGSSQNQTQADGVPGGSPGTSPPPSAAALQEVR